MTPKAKIQPMAMIMMIPPVIRPEKLRLIVYFRLDNFFSPLSPPEERDEERLEKGIRDMFYPAVWGVAEAGTEGPRPKDRARLAMRLHALGSTDAKKFKAVFDHLPHGAEQRQTRERQGGIARLKDGMLRVVAVQHPGEFH